MLDVDQRSTPRATATSERELPDWPGLFDDCPEGDFEVRVRGKLPADLRGTLLRNGPGKRSLSETYLDGAGMLRAYRFEGDGKVRYQSRYVRTRKYVAEEHAKQPLYRGAGTNLPGGVLKNFLRLPQNEANTHVVEHDGTLLALYEGGAPFRIDPRTLDTLGEERFDGELPFHVAFSAHPHLDAATGDLYNFGTELGLQGPHVRVFRWRKHGKVETIARLALRHATFIHDFILAPKHIVFFVAPIVASLPKSLLGLQSYFESARFKPELGTEVWIVPRNGDAPYRLEIEPFLHAHTIGAREIDGELHIHAVESPSWALVETDLPRFRSARFEGLAYQYPFKHRIDLRTRRARREPVDVHGSDFPRSHPRTSGDLPRFAYLASLAKPGLGGLYNGLRKLDLERGSAVSFDHGPCHVSNEPVFVPRPESSDEDDGYVLQQVYVGARRQTDLCVFDARHIDDGPVCTIELPVSAGMSFHGDFLP